MFDITGVLGAIGAFFSTVIEWLQTHGFVIADWFISFFDMAIGSVIVMTVFYIFMPWVDDAFDEED